MTSAGGFMVRERFEIEQRLGNHKKPQGDLSTLSCIAPAIKLLHSNSAACDLLGGRLGKNTIMTPTTEREGRTTVEQARDHHVRSVRCSREMPPHTPPLLTTNYVSNISSSVVSSEDEGVRLSSRGRFGNWYLLTTTNVSSSSSSVVEDDNTVSAEVAA